MPARLGPGFPWETLTINIAGSLLMGLRVGALARGSDGGETARLLIGVGILGGFTTFSSFSMEFWMLFERGHEAQAAAYVLASVTGAIAACRSEEHTSELQSLMRISYAVFCLKKKIKPKNTKTNAALLQSTIQHASILPRQSMIPTKY